jgi:murein DD-endopeptidase MepM/ murein hydrolase activator NlpD
MFNKRKSFFAVAFLLAAGLSITTAVNYTKTKTSETEVNNIVLTDQTEQKGQASVSETIRDTSMTSISAEANIEAIQDNLPKDDEVKIIAYTVKSGDTLDSIASTYNLKAKSIAESNSITTDSVLKEEQVLEFPSIDGVIYKIKSGETLWDLAMLNKVDFNKIVEINKLEAPEKLKLDQKIIMPGIDTVKPIPVKTTNKLVASNTTLSRGGSVPTSTNIIGSLPVSGKITSLFGPRWGRQHEGIDISAPVGTNVYASMNGTVSFSGWDGGYGYLVIIDHSNGLKSYYGHNSKLLVNIGQTVSKGDHIAEVGNTGNSTGPHCHFEIRKNGAPVNPYNYVK